MHIIYVWIIPYHAGNVATIQLNILFLLLSVNSTYNVGLPQLRRIQEEMLHAAIILEEGEGNYGKLFRKSDFFRRHSNFLQITIRANNSEDFFKWLRLCESRLRLLITSLDTPDVNAWPFTKFFERKYNPSGSVKNTKKATSPNNSCLHESFFFIALRFAPGLDSVNLRYCTADFLHKVNSWEERKEGMDLTIAHVLQDDLPEFVFDEDADDDDDVQEPATTASTLPIPEEQPLNDIRAATPKPTLRPQTPTNQEEGSTRLTPKLARSTMLDADVITSPTKRARNDQETTTNTSYEIK
jgi:poly(A) polymerase Pap1